MKRIIFLTVFISVAAIFSTETFASATPSEIYMSIEEQDDYLVDVAKNIRRSFWVQGYKEVSSFTEYMPKNKIDGHVKQSNDYENHLYSDEISELYRCFYSKNCELYLVSTSSEYYGGYGQTAHFILLDTKIKKHDEISHVTYSE